jgi:hypothetical protein
MTKKRINLRKIWILSIFSIIILSFLYIVQVNSITNKSYLLHSLQAKLEKLSEENDELEVWLTKNEPLPNLEVLAQNLNFEKIDRVQYLKAFEGPVAAK